MIIIQIIKKYIPYVHSSCVRKRIVEKWLSKTTTNNNCKKHQKDNNNNNNNNNNLTDN